MTDIDSEERLIRKTFADHLRDRLGWERAYARNTETLGPHGMLDSASERIRCQARRIQLFGDGETETCD